VIARAYLAAVMPDFRYRQPTATLDVRGFPFRAAGRQPIDLGWRAAFREWQPADEKGDEAQLLPALRNGETRKLEARRARRLGLSLSCRPPLRLGRAEQLGADPPTDKAGDKTFGRVSRRERRVQAPRVP